MKEALLQLIKSRTIWTLLFLIAFNVFNETSNLIPEAYATIISVVLATIAGYFRINPKQQF